MPETRKPLWHANYPTERISDDVIGQVMGPNLFGEKLVVVSREVVEDTTRLGFAIATQHDIEATR